MDISDGLAVDVRSMCMASRVGVEIDGDAIPVHPRVRKIAASAKVQPWAFSLASGGDFQFLATVPHRYAPWRKVLALSRSDVLQQTDNSYLPVTVAPSWCEFNCRESAIETVLDKHLPVSV